MKALVLKDEQFVTDAKGQRVGVLLDLKTYKRLREAEEDLAEIRAYDASQSTDSFRVTQSVRDSSRRETLRRSLITRLQNLKNMVLIIHRAVNGPSDT